MCKERLLPGIISIGLYCCLGISCTNSYSIIDPLPTSNSIFSVIDNRQMKVVWVDVVDSNLMLYDTDRMKDTILVAGGIIEDAWPILSTRGRYVYYGKSGKIYGIDLVTSSVYALAKGMFPLAVWLDTISRIEWVYYLFYDELKW